MEISNPQPEAGPNQLFVGALNKQGLSVKSMTDDGRYVVTIGDTDYTISLDNISREFRRDGDPSAFDRFVETIRECHYGTVPLWEEAKGLLRWSAEASDTQGLQDTVHDRISDMIARVLVCVSKDERKITWVDDKHLLAWGVSRADAIKQAEDNLSIVLSRAKLNVDTVEGRKLAYFETSSVFKASFIFAPALKATVESALGWPIYALAPCRTFLYLLRAEDRDFLPRLGGVIVDEHAKSGYPISTEVLEIGDNGITAIGAFQPRKSD